MTATTSSEASSASESEKPVVSLGTATVRFCGVSGDGMQLAGTQLSTSSALLGNDVASFPDFPAEIRAPRGTKAGVSGFQVHFASTPIFTPGDQVDALIAMNPAALKVHLKDVPKGGTVILNTDAFSDRNIARAGYEKNPLEDGTLDNYIVIAIEIKRDCVASRQNLNSGTRRTENCYQMIPTL